MANRKLPTSLSTPPVAGPDYMDAVASKVGMLFDAASLKPTAVTNSGNDYTITVDPVLDADVVASMSFYIDPNASNTGPCRLRVTNSNPYYDLVKATGEALGPGDFATGTAYLVVFMGGEFRILSVANSETGVGASVYYQEFLVSGTWAKPANLDPNAIIMVEIWGGGGGGNVSSYSGGGGGGAYAFDFLRASDLTSSVSITIGAGGSVNAVGGNSSFGSYVTAFGGGRGGTGGGATIVGGGGGGGGASSAGASAGGTNQTNGGNGGGPTIANGLIAMQGTAGGGGATGGVGNYGGGGGGGNATGGTPGGDALYGGGGGGNGGNNTVANGGSSIYGGGGGGGGSGGAAGGTSLYGGNGGTATVAGAVPGGGGGRNAVGGAGKCIVRVVG
ncbi:hypothetical protein [Aminobacter niigataensis]|uniref:hypothetical protein n=1 Tax=Aminobacter niigataensis TaxID=83265 RepID=UPI0024C6F0A4|nr:hypothetical protein [Aminobacter niigataensis]CAI2936030.1 conserved protein of unknown function [Aminobacter niigataensis]